MENIPTEIKNELLDRLSFVQNHQANRGRDIMTFAGFSSTEQELREYVEGHERQVVDLPRA